jgi:hypothetical protein
VNTMAEANTGNQSATNLELLMANLAEELAKASPEQVANYNKNLVKQAGNLTQDQRNKARKAEKDDALAEKNAKASKVHVALTAWMRDIGDEISILAKFERYKNDAGVWVWKLQGLSGENGERWLLDGRSLVLSYESASGMMNYPNYIASDKKHPRGTKLACEALLKGIGVNLPATGSTASTKLKNILEDIDDDGNPAGKSQFRHAIEKCWITHEDVNGGKPQKLVEYYLSTLTDEDEEEETEA